MSHLTVAFTVDEDKEMVLDLQLNRDLLPQGYFEKYHHQVRTESSDIDQKIGYGFGSTQLKIGK